MCGYLICNYTKHAVTSRYSRSHVFSFPRKKNVKQMEEKYCDIKCYVCTEYTAVLVIYHSKREISNHVSFIISCFRYKVWGAQSSSRLVTRNLVLSSRKLWRSMLALSSGDGSDICYHSLGTHI